MPTGLTLAELAIATIIKQHSAPVYFSRSNRFRLRNDVWRILSQVIGGHIRLGMNGCSYQLLRVCGLKATGPEPKLSVFTHCKQLVIWM